MVANIDDNYFKKQMEFKQGKLHQLITDQEVNTNKIFANRYGERGLIGFWYFLLDCIYHFENFMLLFLILMIIYGMSTSVTASTEQSIPLEFPLVALIVNVVLMAIRNIIFENRQVKVTRRINNKLVNALFVSRSRSRFVPFTWEKIKPGQVIQIRRGEEFPADCLILDISGLSG